MFWDALKPMGIPIVLKNFSVQGFCPAIVLVGDSRVDPPPPHFFLFACRMTSGQDETSTSQVRRKKGPSREFPSASNLVSSMSMKELRSFCRVLDGISLELSDGPAISIVGEANNVVYFTREQFTVGIRFPVSSLVKQFLHVS